MTDLFRSFSIVSHRPKTSVSCFIREKMADCPTRKKCLRLFAKYTWNTPLAAYQLVSTTMPFSLVVSFSLLPVDVTYS